MIRFPLFIQYDDRRMTDGFGAQGIRVLGIFAISKFFRLKYVHQEISELSNRYELMGPNASDARYAEVLSTLNSYICPVDEEIWQSPEKPIDVEIYDLGFRTLARYFFKSLIRPNRYLLKVCLPFGVTDRMPTLYLRAVKSLKMKRGFKDYELKNESIVVHVRTGEHSPAYPRHQLGPEYYARVIFNQGYGDLDNDHWIVHTDFQESDFQVSSNSQRATKFRNLFLQLDSFKNIEINHYAAIEIAFRDMVNSKVLIVSRSALSYLAALLSEGLIIFPSNHGHSPLPHWIRESAD